MSTQVMEALEAFAEKVFMFILMPLGALCNMGLSLAMPSLSMKAAYFVFSAGAVLCIMLGLVNVVVKRRGLEAKLYKVIHPTACISVAAAAACVGLYYFGV